MCNNKKWTWHRRKCRERNQLKYLLIRKSMKWIIEYNTIHLLPSSSSAPFYALHSLPTNIQRVNRNYLADYKDLRMFWSDLCLFRDHLFNIHKSFSPTHNRLYRRPMAVVEIVETPELRSLTTIQTSRHKP